MTQGNYDPRDPRAFSPGPLPGGAVPGDLWIRFAARLIDGLLVSIVVYAVLIPLSLVTNTWVPGLLSGLLFFGYYVAFEVTQGWTPGKKILKLHVLGARGAPKPTAQESAIRNSFLLLSIIPFYIGAVLSLIAYIVIAVTINSSPTKQGKHDELAGGTQVIKEP